MLDFSRAESMLNSDAFEKYYPMIFLFIIAFPLILLGAPISSIFSAIALFIPSYMFFRHFAKFPVFESAAFALPFSIAFSTIFFRLGLLFGLEAMYGWAALAIGWLAIFLASSFLPKGVFPALRPITLFPANSEGRIRAAVFLAISFASIIVYSLVIGPIDAGKTIWLATDANWQTARLGYHLSSDNFEVPPYVCAGLHGFESDSYTSTASLAFPFLVSKFGMANAALGQQIALYLGFLLLVQGVFLLFCHIFKSTFFGVVSIIFLLLPFSRFSLFTEIFGMWRVSIFNSFFPWAFLLLLLPLGSFALFAARFAIVALASAVQPFSALILGPVYIAGILNSKNETKKLIEYAAFTLLVAMFLFFTFAQPRLAAGTLAGSSSLSLAFGTEGVAKLDALPTLSPHLQISLPNIGLPILFFIACSFLFSCYLSYDEWKGSKKLGIFFILAATYLLAIFLSSGIFFVSNPYAQYMLKLRYSVILLLASPFISFALFRAYQFHRLLPVPFILMLVIYCIISLSYFQLAGLSEALISDSVAPVLWLKENAQENSAVLYPQIIIQQSLIHQSHLRHSEIPGTVEKDAGAIMCNEEEVECSVKRFGLFDVRKVEIDTVPSDPDYVISPAVMNSSSNMFFVSFLLGSGYSPIYNDSGYLVFERGKNAAVYCG